MQRILLNDFVKKIGGKIIFELGEDVEFKSFHLQLQNMIEKKINVDGFIFGNATNITYDGDRWKRCLDRYFQHDDPYVEYKYYKCQWHKIPLLNEYDIIVWIDSTLELKNIPSLLKNAAKSVSFRGSASSLKL